MLNRPDEVLCPFDNFSFGPIATDDPSARNRWVEQELGDLDRLQEATIEKDGRVITTRTHVTGQVGNVFKAAGVALPNNLDEQPA